MNDTAGWNTRLSVSADRLWRRFRAWPPSLRFLTWLVMWWALVPILVWRSSVRPLGKWAVTAASLAALGVGGFVAAQATGPSARLVAEAAPAESSPPTGSPSPAEPASSSPSSTSSPHGMPPRSEPNRIDSRCPDNPLLGVYHPARLLPLRTCRWFRGTVIDVRPEEDGDYHVIVNPAPRFERFVNDVNRSAQDGGLVIEIMPGQSLPVPSVGESVSFFGTWVLDLAHGWNEIHPVWAIRYVDRGRALFDLPPRTPLYNPGSGEVASPGGEGEPGGGNCDSSYPTVCIPPPPPDLDCADVDATNFEVVGSDPHGFDGDGDGVGCET